MTRFFIPVERTALPTSDPKRWMMLDISCSGEIEARTLAQRQADAILPHEDVCVWAALTVLPSFDWLAAQRAGFDRTKAGQQRLNAARARADRLAVA